MRAVAHSPKFAKKVGVPQSVGKDFEMADKKKKVRKFADGGSDKYKARYDRKVADIESDYKKAQARKTGRAAEVAKAKYEQRMADAKDDLAKWTKSDRTATSAAEKAAEKNLSMTRKFGARSSEGLVNKAEEKLASKAPLSSVNTSSVKGASDDNLSFAQKFRMERDRLGGGKTFTWRGKSYSTNMAGEGASRPAAKKPATTTQRTNTTTTRTGTMTQRAAPAQQNKPAVTAAAKKNDPFAKDSKGNYVDNSAAAGSARARANAARMFGVSGASAPFTGLRELARKKDELEAKRAAEAEANAKAKVPVTRLGADPYGFYGKKKGGTVKKYKTGGPVMESKRKPIDTRRSVLGSDKDIIARGNRTPYEPIPKTGPDKPKQKPLGRAGKAGFKSGGSVMKKSDKAGRALVKKSADTMGRAMKKYAKGGSIDGCAIKGKTKAKHVKMNKGGYC